MADAYDTAPGRALVPAPAMRIRDGHIRSGWFGMWWLIATEGALFGYLLFSYYYSLLQASGPWPPEGAPALTLALPNTFVLLASSVAVWSASAASGKVSDCRCCAGLLGHFCSESCSSRYSSRNGATSRSRSTRISMDRSISPSPAFHMAHVVVGLLVLAALGFWAFRGYYSRERHEPASIGALYWHFVDAVWLAVFTTFYLVPLVR